MLKVIVLEDEPAARRELVLLTPWEKYGMICAGEAADGAEGLVLIEEKNPDIVITDIRMPGIDGLSFIETLVKRAAEKEIATPEVIILSGYSEFEYARRAMRLGVDEYLLKPVEDDALEAALLRKAAKIRSRSPHHKAELLFFNESERKQFDSECLSYVDESIRIIEERYIQGVSIEEVAGELGLSAGHLSRIFKRGTGYTFVDYLTHVRIKRAMELLRDPAVKIYEVADLVGYLDARYFAQVFKKIAGVTPHDFKDGIVSIPASSDPGFESA
ncbi:MAG: DNA-binding response regulator [Spirochaetae bacterium HGW-Spirochaetae-9]|nr:MAG: DNA-binding response regulator [Spirochaetae bacterium HGW-Spirochaetae-9]